MPITYYSLYKSTAYLIEIIPFWADLHQLCIFCNKKDIITTFFIPKKSLIIPKYSILPEQKLQLF